MIYAAEVTAYYGDGGTEVKFYFSSSEFVTKSTDTPSNIAFVPRLIDAGSIGIHLDIGNLSTGKVNLETGELTIINSDGAYDYLSIDHNFGGRDITIRYGQDGAAYPSGFTTFFKGTCDTLEITCDKLIFRLKDASYMLDRPLLVDVYGGTNSLPNGIDGAADDIKGEVIPRILGQVYNAEPVCVNTSKLIYQVHSSNAIQTINAVYDSGVSITFGVNHATNALLQSNTPSASTYDSCKAEGLIRLGSTPTGIVTIDCNQGATAANRTVAQKIKGIASTMGITSYASDVTDLDALNSNVVGLYVNDERTATEAMNQIASSIQAFYYFDREGRFRMGQIQSPSLLSTYTDIYENDVLEIEQIGSITTIPCWKARVNYKQIELVQTSELAGSVTIARKAFLSKKSRKASNENSLIKNSHKNAKEIVVDSRLTVEADALNEAIRLWGIFNSPSFLWDVTIPLDKFNFDLMSGVTMYHPRFNLWKGVGYNPTSCAIIGYVINSSDNTAILRIWGKFV